MTVIERWITICPVHGPSHRVQGEGLRQGCWFWSTDDAQCREEVEYVRLTSDRGTVKERDDALADAEHWKDQAQHLRRALDACQSRGAAGR